MLTPPSNAHFAKAMRRAENFRFAMRKVMATRLPVHTQAAAAETALAERAVPAVAGINP